MAESLVNDMLASDIIANPISINDDRLDVLKFVPIIQPFKF